jgi:acylphosphatase
MQLRATVWGYVQGVGFRYFVGRTAKGLMIRGFVQNRPDGSVYVLADGERSALEQLLSALYRGPSQARVDSVDVEWSNETIYGLPSKFEVRH